MGRAKLIAIGLATPTIEPLLGLNDGAAKTGGPVYGVGSCPAGVPSGITVGAGAGAPSGLNGGGAIGSPGGGKPNGIGAGGGTSPNGGGAGASIGCESIAAGSGLTSGSAQADGLPTANPPTRPAAKIAVANRVVARLNVLWRMRHLQYSASSVTQRGHQTLPAMSRRPGAPLD